MAHLCPVLPRCFAEPYANHLSLSGTGLAVEIGMNANTNQEETMRNVTAMMLVPVLKMTGFRFSKEYRWGTTRYHRTVYALVNTIKANMEAGM